MKRVAHKAVAIVGVGAVLPDAPSAPVFWQNIKDRKYSIGDVPPERWNPDLYYDPDPKAPDKSYTKIGGWVREYNWEPLKWRLPIPPKVSEAMDLTQRWAISAAREALMDYGYPGRILDPERTAVILGNAMGGDTHLYTASRILFPEFAVELSKASAFSDLPPEVQEKIFQEFRSRISKRFPEITEDTMPGELSNIIAGRIAALYNFRGPNYVADAACASAMAAMSAAVKGLEEYDFDAVITGGIDANMSASTYVKFCKIGALSATGTRPYAKGADGFVMGEGAAVFLIKRLEDAERDGDKIYAVLRAFGGSSDGKGKGITAPNPVGQKLAVKRAWENAGIPLSSVGLIEGHGTSTAVGDAVELQCLDEVFEGTGLPKGSVALGSVKSNIGHLKGAAGAAGMLKAAFALHEKVLPPSLNFKVPNPKIDFNKSAFYVNTELKPWKVNGNDVRRAGVSAFGFGGTNFHAVMEEYIPGRILEEEKKLFAGAEIPRHTSQGISVKAPLRGALVIGAESETALLERLQNVILKAQNGEAPPPRPPLEKDLRSPVRLAIDYGNATELSEKALKAQKALQANQPAMWKILRAQGIFLGRGPAAKVAFLYTGQGSQYVNMLKELAEKDPIVARVFEEADRVMIPLLGKPLTEYIFVDGSVESKVKQANKDLMQTAITQPAVLTVDLALTRLLAEYGITPDMVMGHSLGEYGALVAAGVLTFDNALKAVSARGTEMTKVSVEDNGLMAAVFAPLNEIEKIVNRVDGYVEIANINSYSQSVIGGATEAVKKAVLAIKEAGYDARMLPVSHAFHTKIVAPASKPLSRVLAQMDLQSPNIPIVANVTGEFYPMGPGVVPEMLDLLSRQVESPVQFIKGLKTLYKNGARVFVEVGPKKALHGFVEDVLGQNDDVLALFTNHPKTGDLVSFNQALCGLYAAGLGAAETAKEMEQETAAINMPSRTQPASAPTAQTVSGQSLTRETAADSQTEADKYLELGHLFGEFLERGFQIYSRGKSSPQSRPQKVWITGAAMGLPGTDRVFDDANVERIFSGQQFIDLVPPKLRELMVDKNITRVVKSADGSGSFETIHSADEVIKLAARAVNLDIHRDFGFPEDRIAALDTVTALAIGAGIDAMRDAGIPLLLHYKTTTKGTKLPEKWQLPDEMRDDTGIIFTSAFPGYDSFAGEMERYFVNRALRQRLNDLQELRKRFTQINPSANGVLDEIDRKIELLNTEMEKHPYVFERRFLFKVLSMGHSQFAEYIGARGPNTQINSACASFTTAVGLANDWIQAGRCRRVIIISADNITSDRLMDWFGAGFLASGAAATDEDVKEVAIPFDRRRHGMIIGMGSAAIVVENTDSAKERGLQPIAEVLSTITANSAFHGTRLDVNHISQVMEKLISEAEAKWGINRYEIAPQTVFVSHETYTPARGGSAAAEVNALRHVFGASANRIVIANTKGFTGHPMGVGIEDVVGIKAIETGIVPPVANFKEVDPELGPLNLSTGGHYPVEYALRLGAGFGSQISMMLIRRVPTKDGIRRKPSQLGYAYRIADQKVWQEWLDRVTGYRGAELEVEKRTLRVKDQGPASPRVKRPEAALQKIPSPPEEPVVSQPVPGTEESTKVAAANVPEVGETATADTTAKIAAVETSLDPVREKVLQLISEQTGYPPDMLEMDLDLEADLGIDTVKQAEMFAAVREAYDIPREDSLQLRDFPTLAHVIQFVYDRRPDLKPSARPSPAEGSQAGTPPGESKPVVETPSAPSPEVSGEDPVKAKVLELIAEKTGYPPDMLDLDLDLEADLGIDTVKQAEMFAAVREAYDIPREDNLQLREFPTLNHVIQFVYDRRPELKGASAGTTEISPEPEKESIVAEKTGEHLPTGDMEETLKIPRRVPTPQLRPPLEFCKPTGVKFTKESRVIIMPDQGGVAKALVTKLTKLGATPLLIKGAPAAEKLTEQIAQWLQEGPVQGVYWLPALDAEGDIATMDMKTWQQAAHKRIKLLYNTMRTLYDHIGKTGTFLISATRLGGQHGYDESGALAPLGGAVAGFTKTYKREKNEATVKVLDFEQTRKTTALADILIQETMNDPGAVEIGYKNGARWSIGLQEVPAENGQPGMELNKDTVFLVTGAAGSITSAITADLAAASGGTFYLLDLAPDPDPENPDIKRFEMDKEGLKRDIFMRLKEKGDRATPAMVEKQLSGLEREHAALMAIQAVEKAGGTAIYHSVNLLDAKAMTRIMKEIKKKSGRIDVLIHAGGLEISHLLPDKNPAEFDLVFDVKSSGWYHILSNLGDMPLSAAVVFSSIAGRFGNAGQTDYSSANDFLCKSVSNFRTIRPQTRGIAIDWTAWGGIGMATRGSIPTIMKQAGIDMLPPEAGIPFIRRELTAGNRSDEVVVGLRLGVMLNEFDDTGGLDVSESGKLNKVLAKRGIMLETVKGMGLYSGLTVEVALDPEKQPFLHDHQIGGTPVLPGVMGIEALVEAAKAIFPGLNLAAVEEVEFSAPFKFYRSEPRTVTVRATFSKEGDDIIAYCQLMGSRKLHGQGEAQTTLHFTARVRLSKNPFPKPHPRKKKITAQQKVKKVQSSDIYKLYFHGPAYQVLDKCWRSGNTVVGLYAGKLPPNHHPEELATLVNPRLIELCFQTAGIWEMGSKGRMGLPSQIRKLRVYTPGPAENGKLFAVVNPGENGSFDAEVIDENGNVYISLEGYRTSELPNDMDSELLKPLQEAMQKPSGKKKNSGRF